MKTFELTQEQINQLAEKKHAKELLQQFIPEAFENKLEVGKWYKSKNHNKKTLFFTNKETCDEDMGYGFDFIGRYYETDFVLSGSKPEDFELATEEEVREALINEAKKRGYNEGVKCKFGIIEDIRTIETNIFDWNGKYLFVRCINGNADIIFKNGKWAEIIEEPKETKPTKEEINRVLTFLKNKNEQ